MAVTLSFELTVRGQAGSSPRPRVQVDPTDDGTRTLKNVSLTKTKRHGDLVWTGQETYEDAEPGSWMFVLFRLRADKGVTLDFKVWSGSTDEEPAFHTTNEGKPTIGRMYTNSTLVKT